MGGFWGEKRIPPMDYTGGRELVYRSALGCALHLKIGKGQVPDLDRASRRFHGEEQRNRIPAGRLAPLPLGEGRLRLRQRTGITVFVLLIRGRLWVLYRA